MWWRDHLQQVHLLARQCRGQLRPMCLDLHKYNHQWLLRCNNDCKVVQVMVEIKVAACGHRNTDDGGAQSGFNFVPYVADDWRTSSRTRSSASQSCSEPGFEIGAATANDGIEGCSKHHKRQCGAPRRVFGQGDGEIRFTGPVRDLELYGMIQVERNFEKMLFWGPDNFCRVFTADRSAEVWVFTCQGWLWKVRALTHCSFSDFKTSAPNNNLVLLANLRKSLEPGPLFNTTKSWGECKRVASWTGVVSVLASVTYTQQLLYQPGSLRIKSRAALPNTLIIFIY